MCAFFQLESGGGGLVERFVIKRTVKPNGDIIAGPEIPDDTGLFFESKFRHDFLRVFSALKRMSQVKKFDPQKLFTGCWNFVEDAAK